MNILRIVFFALLAVSVSVSESAAFDLIYPAATHSSEIQQERYDKLEVWVKGKGYVSVYGHTWKQDITYPKFVDGKHNEAVRSFFVKSLNIKPSDISEDNYGHFRIDGKEYWLKLSVFSTSYSYVLLRVEGYPETVTLDEKASPVFTKSSGKVSFPPNIAIPLVKGFGIGSVNYKKYDEFTFFYDRKANLHKGRFWNISFERSTDDDNSCRYAVPHDYRDKILQLGATILKDGDNEIHFRLERDGGVNIIKFGADNNRFSIQIIQEEAFKQSLVLSPDAIKSELDQKGKVALEGIYFDFNKATLKEESNKAVLSVVALMERYPDLVLAVHGHTDSKGSDSYNMTLSSDRAAAVRDAIISHGIEGTRLQSQGFGESQPIASNDTDEGRAENRRVELHKVSGGEKKAVISIDFIKPLENSVVESKYSYPDSSLTIQYSKPYSPKKELRKFAGTQNTISYIIMKDNRPDESVSRKEIIKNYINVLELYDAEIVGAGSSSVDFKIDDRGDGVSVYGRIEGYSGRYTIRFLLVE